MAGSRAVARFRHPDPAHVTAVATGLVALAVYRATLLPGLGAWDTAEAQTVLPTMSTMHPTGFPAYVVLGWLTTHALAPLGSPAFLVNLLSAMLVATAVGTSVLVTRRLGAHLAIGAAVAIGFALTPVVWRLALAADVHALHLALLVVLTALLLRWAACVDAWRAEPDGPGLRARADRALVLAAAVFGVALANHALALLLLPAIGLYVLAVEPGILGRPRIVLASLGACAVFAALLYLELPLRAGPFRGPLVYGHPETWGGFWDVVLARQFQGSVGGPLADAPARLGALAKMVITQFGPLVVLIPSGLLVAAVRHPRYALLSGVAALITCVFAAWYANAAIERYYAGPVFFAWTWIAALAAELVARFGASATSRPASPPASGGRRTLVAAAVVGLVVLAPSASQLAPRWRAVDLSRQTWAQEWLDRAFAAIAPDSVVISWWSYSTPLWYGQVVEGLRPDIDVVDDRSRVDLGLGGVGDVIEANVDHRPVYLIRVQESEVHALGDRYLIVPIGSPGNLYRVTGRKETGS